MRFSRRPRIADCLSDDSLALLSALPPRYTADVRLSRSNLVRSRRRLEVRADQLLLLKSVQYDNTGDKLNKLRADDVITCVPLSSIMPRSSRSTTVASSALSAPNRSSSVLVTEKRRTTLIIRGFRVSFDSDADVRALEVLLTSTQQSTLLAASNLTERDEQLLASDSKLSSLPLLGSGATADVRQLRPGVAVKLVRKADVFDNDGALEQAVSERLAYGWFEKNPFILHLLAARQTERFLCFATEAAHFGDLHSILTRIPDSRFPVEVARAVFAELVAAIAAVHRAGVLFRDVKLANVLITKTGHVRLADFGLVKRPNGATRYGSPTLSSGSVAKPAPSEMSSAVSATSSSSSSEDSEDDDFDGQKYAVLGRASSFVGTRRYMSPEVWGSGGNSVRSYGAAADLWALGVTLYIMLTGRYPFSGDESSSSPTSTCSSSNRGGAIGRTSARVDSRGLFLSICNDDVKVPDFVDEDAASLLQGLLTRDVLERFDIAAVQKHPWLRDVDWGRLHRDGVMDTPNDVVVDFLRECDVPAAIERNTSASRQVVIPRESAVTDKILDEDSATCMVSTLLGFEACGNFDSVLT